VLDGYGFEADYQRALRTAVRQLVVLDEAGRACDAADLVVNQNLHATAALYPWAAAAPERLALGPSFALLRREFEAWRRWRRPQVTVPRRVLVTMGGADPANATARVLAVLGRVARDLEVRVVVGPANPRPAALAAALERAGLRGALTTVTTEMPALMAWADLAVSAAGSTVWELAFMGLPSVVVPIADNQRPIAAAAEAAGVALAADPAAAAHSEALAGAVLRLRDDAGCRRELSARGRRLVDGGGAGRVASRLTAGRLAAR
jgi:spore coat polysaccharide biosynthesis predicted glycosyltransferase SpsG